MAGQLLTQPNGSELIRWTDAAGEPLRRAEEVSAPPGAAGVAYPVELPRVGRAYLWASYTAGHAKSSALEYKLAARYLEAAGALIKRYARRGVPMEQAQAHWQAAQAHWRAEAWHACLSESVLAAEQSAVALARARLQRMGGHGALLWGIVAQAPSTLVAGLESDLAALSSVHALIRESDPAWSEAFRQAQSARLAVGAALTASPLPNALALSQAIAAYRGQVRYWCLATQIQQLPPTKETLNRLGELSEQARAADIGVLRVLHGVHSWHAHYSPYRVLEACVDAGIPFELIQLEWHWYDGCLYDLDQLLERYGELGKPMQVMLHMPPEGGWNDFKRTEPLSWVEGAALIALSKPYVVAIYVPAAATDSSAGALESDAKATPYWHQIAQVAAWNRQLS